MRLETFADEVVLPQASDVVAAVEREEVPDHAVAHSAVVEVDLARFLQLVAGVPRERRNREADVAFAEEVDVARDGLLVQPDQAGELVERDLRSDLERQRSRRASRRNPFGSTEDPCLPAYRRA